MIDYFGAWPGWFPVFLASCKFNPTINWVIKTDCVLPANPPSNVRFINMRYEDYIAAVSSHLNLEFRPSSSYKICDIRPMLGDIFYEDIKSFDYYGFGDLDVIYGDIRKFYTEQVLTHDVISTHTGMLSGHLSLFKNTDVLRFAYQNIPNWIEFVRNPDSVRFDEDIYSTLFFGHSAQNSEENFSVYSREQYSTVFHPMPWHDGSPHHPDVWFWKDGKITNDKNIGRDYLYLHLMNFQSMRWTTTECRQGQTAWKENPNALFDLTSVEENGVCIEWSGIRSLNCRG